MENHTVAPIAGKPHRARPPREIQSVWCEKLVLLYLIAAAQSNPAGTVRAGKGRASMASGFSNIIITYGNIATLRGR